MVGRSFGGGKFDPEAAALVRLGLEAGAATHAFGASVHQGQSHAGPRVFFRTVETLEEAENLFMIFAGNANAVVLDPDSSEA